jgi:hypothetical protein
MYPSHQGEKPIPKEWIDKLMARLYLECMFKFVGDFSQVLYGYYLGSIFASFDRSAITMAMFVMKSLLRSPERYKKFKMGVPDAAGTALFEERMARGLLLLTSTTYHHKAVPKVTYYADIHAAVNIEKGINGTVVQPLKHYLDKMGVDRIDEDARPDALAELGKAVRRRRVAPPIAPVGDDVQAVMAPSSLRGMKKALLQKVEEDHVKSVDNKMHALLRKVFYPTPISWKLYSFVPDVRAIYHIPTVKYYMSWIRKTVKDHLGQVAEREVAFVVKRLENRLKSMLIKGPEGQVGIYISVPRDQHPVMADYAEATTPKDWSNMEVEEGLKKALNAAANYDAWLKQNQSAIPPHVTANMAKWQDMLVKLENGSMTPESAATLFYESTQPNRSAMKPASRAISAMKTKNGAITKRTFQNLHLNKKR